MYEEAVPIVVTASLHFHINQIKTIQIDLAKPDNLYDHAYINIR